MNCEDCKHRIGDGHPYGDITCRVNGKYRNMRRECDTGEYAPIVSDKEIIKQLQSEVDGLKCCGNCKHMDNVGGYDYCYVACKTDYRFDSGRVQVCGNDRCYKWEGVSMDD